MNNYAKQMYIDAIMWTWDCSRSVAERKYREYVREKRQTALDEMARGYEEQCKRSFYED